jgi:8-oxo-dGTP diphosphatase
MKRLMVSLGIVVKDMSSDCHLWLQLRREDGPLDNHWEFPGGKIEPDETPHQALVREFLEECEADLSGARAHLLGIYPYDYEDRMVSLYSYIVDGKGLTLKSGQWVKLDCESAQLAENMKLMPANNQILADFCRFWRGNRELIASREQW